MTDSELLRLPDQLRPHVEGTLPRRRGCETEGLEDFRTYFITVATNTNATMHYQFFHIRSRSTGEQSDAPFEDPGAGTTPSGME